MLIKCKAPADTASGKHARELVYYPWRGQQAARNFILPANPRSNYQIAVRVNFTNLSRAWQTLTADQRASWEAYAATHTLINRLGNAFTGTGNMAFMSCNRNLQAFTPESGLRSDAPTIDPPTTPTEISWEVTQAGDHNIAVICLATLVLDPVNAVVLRALITTSAAQNPPFSKLPLVSGPSEFSSDGWTGTHAHEMNYEQTTASFTNGDRVAYALQQLDAQGQISPPATGIAIYIT